MKNSKFKIHMTYALGKASLDCKIPPAVATPLDKGGRGGSRRYQEFRNGELRKS
jgi:hypothetical protein